MPRRRCGQNIPVPAQRGPARWRAIASPRSDATVPRVRPAVKYGCSQEDVCVVSAGGAYYDDQCDGICDPQGYKWACIEGRCVESDARGNYSDDSCAHRCEAPAPGPPPPPRYSCNRNGTCHRDESGIFPYYLTSNCDGECGHGPVPGPAPAPAPPGPPPPPPPPEKGSTAAHVVLVVVLVLLSLAAAGGLGFAGLHYKRRYDEQKAYREMGPQVGDPLLQ